MFAKQATGFGSLFPGQQALRSERASRAGCPLRHHGGKRSQSRYLDNL